MIGVNVTTERLVAELDVPGLGGDPPHVLFEEREVDAHGGSIHDPFAPLAVHVHRWPSSR